MAVLTRKVLRLEVGRLAVAARAEAGGGAAVGRGDVAAWCMRGATGVGVGRGGGGGGVGGEGGWAGGAGGPVRGRDEGGGGGEGVRAGGRVVLRRFEVRPTIWARVRGVLRLGW